MGSVGLTMVRELRRDQAALRLAYDPMGSGTIEATVGVAGWR